jgi:hypothetical protein
MADDETDPPADPPESDLPKRVSSLEGKIDTILAKLSGDGGGTEPEPEGAPNVAYEIRQQLDERERKAKAKADAEANGLKAELGEVKVKLSELAEKPPGPLPRKIEKWMGWTG